MKFIQLSGIGRAGKTTTANYLAAKAIKENYIPVILPFAKALKDEVANDGVTKDKDPMEYRTRCQTKGAQLRAKDPDYFVKKVKEEVARLTKEELFLREHNPTAFEHIIINDDTRYMNEIAWGREVDAYQLFVTPSTRTVPQILGEWRDHESEQLCNEVEIGNMQYTDLFHEYVVNNGTEENLKAIVDKRFWSWMSEPEQSNDAVSLAFRNGDSPSDQFILRLLIKSQDSTTTDVDAFLEALEDLEFKRDDEEPEFFEGAD